jgi:hypothetical protein
MTFQVEITPIAESQIEKAYQWYRERNPKKVSQKSLSLQLLSLIDQIFLGIG